MPRRREVPKRETLPDPAYGSTLISKFISCMMIQGKKSVAEGAFYGSLELVKDRAKEDPVKVFKKAIDNVKPILEVKSRRVGGATYQVPIEVSQDRRTSLGDSLDYYQCTGAWRKDHAREAGSRDFWMPLIIAVALLRRRKIRTAWRKPTRLLPITVGKEVSPWVVPYR